jgi:hypothetical protein
MVGGEGRVADLQDAVCARVPAWPAKGLQGGGRGEECRGFADPGLRAVPRLHKRAHPPGGFPRLAGRASARVIVAGKPPLPFR